MTKEEINEFSVRISQSTKTELVAITCEIAVNYMKSAVEALDKNSTDDFRFNLDKAMAFIDDLSGSLDMQYSISYNLISLYMFVKKVIMKSSIRKEKGDMDEAIKIMTQIGEAFATVAKNNMEIAKNDMSMDGGETIYTGYTYGRDSRLDEYIVRN